MRHQQAYRTAVLGGEGLAAVRKGEEIRVAVEVREREVCGEVLLGAHEDEPRTRERARAREQLAHGCPTEAIVEPAPPRNAVDVAHGLLLRQRAELAPGDLERVRDQTGDAESPRREVHRRDPSGVEHRPLPGLDLTGGNPRCLGARVHCDHRPATSSAATRVAGSVGSGTSPKRPEKACTTACRVRAGSAGSLVASSAAMLVMTTS